MNILPEHKLLISDVRQNGSGPVSVAVDRRCAADHTASVALVEGVTQTWGDEAEFAADVEGLTVGAQDDWDDSGYMEIGRASCRERV